jgi:hypothetical protein
MLKFLLFSVIIISISTSSILSAASASSSDKLQISGSVIDADTQKPIVGANIALMNRYGGSIADKNGNFIIINLSEGMYQLRISHIGYENKIIDSLYLKDEDIVDLRVELKKKPVSVKGITVTPGLFSIMGNEPAARQILSRKVIETRPQLSEDLFRAVQRLPGMTFNDFSAKFNVRGGEQDEVLISIDGMELYEPFHLKDVDGGVLGITDLAAVEGVDMMTGGYPANFGDRMSGIFNIKSKNPDPDKNRMELGLSLLNARILSEGTFANNKGSWLFSGRRGYMDLVFNIAGTDNELQPRYYDFYGKLQYELSKSNILVASVLHADDKLRYQGIDEDIGDTVNSSYGNSYFWLTLYSTVGSKLSGRSMGYVGKVNNNRTGQLYNLNQGIVETEVDDDRNFNLQGFKSDWEYEVSNNFLVKAGFDYKHMSADYDYSGSVFKYSLYDYGGGPIYQLDGIDSNIVLVDTKGEKLSGYISNRVRLFDPVTAEVGVRYDYASYSGDDILSPRANLVVHFSPVTSLKLGWGDFYQIQRVDEISVQDGETDFYEAERAKHYVAGFEHRFDTGEKFRLQVFYKKYDFLRPTYRNTFGELASFPELEEDRVRVNLNGKVSKGVEVYVKKNTGEKLSWWFSYSYSDVKDDIRSIYYFDEKVLVNYNREFPFTYDQKHTIYVDLNVRLNLSWQFNVAWQYHTGWPYTNVFIGNRIIGGSRRIFIQSGEPWNEKYPPYKRLDVRLNKKFLMSNGTLTTFVEVINVFNDKNVRNFEYNIRNTNNVISLDEVSENWFGVMPSFGIVYNFNL